MKKIKENLFLNLEKQFPTFFTPNGAMRLSLGVYLLKVPLKIILGGLIAGSMIIMADGFHNMADIAESGLIIIAMTLSSRTSNGKYPFGRRNIESIAVLIIGMILCYIALQILATSIIGICTTLDINIPSYITGELIFNIKHENAIGELYWPLTAIMVLSIALAFIVSTIQIQVGKKFAKPIIVGDGLETRGDGIVELVAMVGISGEYFFHAPWVEYIFGPFAVILLGKTGLELIANGWRTLLQRSIGAEHELAIKNIAQKTYGVADIGELKTFMIGGMVIVIMKVLSICSGKTERLIKKVLAEDIGQYLSKNEFPDYDWYIRFETPHSNYHRIAYAIIKDGVSPPILAPNLLHASHVRIVDVGDGKPIRCRDWPTNRNMEENIYFLSQKHVQVIISYEELDSSQNKALIKAGISCKTTATPDLTELGISK